jgi:hypothetical protein
MLVRRSTVKVLGVEITPNDIIEAVVDELATGDLAQSVDAFQFTRISSGELLLAFGEAGRFVLTVRPVAD